VAKGPLGSSIRSVPVTDGTSRLLVRLTMLPASIPTTASAPRGERSTATCSPLLCRASLAQM